MLAGWLEASAGDIALAADDLDAAARLAADLADPVLADVERHRSFLAVQQGRPDAVLGHAAAALETYRAHRLAWPTAGSLLLAGYGSLMLGDRAAATGDVTGALRVMRPLGDAWATVHGEGMLAGIAQAQQRHDEAARALERAADDSARLGFLGQAALHRTNLARARQRLRDPAASADLERAIREALAVGDCRLAATARFHLARALRGQHRGAEALDLLEENERWFAASGGGDHALASRCLLAAERRDERTLRTALDEARDAGDPEAQVLALDGLARLSVPADPESARSLLAAADELLGLVRHTLDETDRVDASVARDVLAERVDDRGEAAG